MRLLILLTILLVGCSAKAPVVVDPISDADLHHPHQVNLSWKLPPQFSGFTIYRSTNNVFFTQIAVVTGPQTTYVDKNVQARVKYYYKMKTSCNSCKPSLSNYSNVVNITVP